MRPLPLAPAGALPDGAAGSGGPRRGLTAWLLLWLLPLLWACAGGLPAAAAGEPEVVVAAVGDAEGGGDRAAPLLASGHAVCLEVEEQPEPRDALAVRSGRRDLTAVAHGAELAPARRPVDCRRGRHQPNRGPPAN